MIALEGCGHVHETISISRIQSETVKVAIAAITSKHILHSQPHTLIPGAVGMQIHSGVEFTIVRIIVKSQGMLG
jgi:hypothetical protein